MINAFSEDLEFRIQEGTVGTWKRVVDTSKDSPDDILERGREEPVRSLVYPVKSRSVVVLVGDGARR